MVCELNFNTAITRKERNQGTRVGMENPEVSRREMLRENK